MPKPLFSVILPVYNAERWLDECLSSILTQSFSDFEVILVDDGSTDESPGICDSYAAKYPGTVRAIHQANQGCLRARLTGYKEALGEYMASADPDDISDEGLLSEAEAVIEKFHPDIVMFGYALIDEEGQRIGVPHEHEFPEGKVDKEEWLYRFLMGDVRPALWSRVFRKELLDFSCFSPEICFCNHCDDQPLSVSVALRADNIYYLDKVLYYWRQNPKSVTKTFNKGTYEWLNLNVPHVLKTISESGLDAGRTAKARHRYCLDEIWLAVCRVMRSGLGKEEKYTALREILSYRVAEEERKHLDTPDPLPQRRLGLRLFYGGHFTLLSALLKGVDIGKKILMR